MTQASLGALIGELMMGKRLGKRALAWGALFGVMPDLVFLLSPLLDTAREIYWRQGPTHSLAVMAAGSWGIARGLAKLWRRDKIGVAPAGAFVFAVWWVHVLVDCSSTAGAAVLWPLTSTRVAFRFLAAGDFLLTVPLVLTALWLAFSRERKAQTSRSRKAAPPRSARRLWTWRILGTAAAYSLLALGMKFIASAGFDADLARRGTTFTRRIESPAPYNILLWRAVVDRESEFWVGYRSVFESRGTPVRWTVYLKNAAALEKVAGLRETKTLAVVSDGWWIARPHAKGAWLGDLRFPEDRVWGSKKGMVDSRLAASWVIEADRKSERLRENSAAGFSGDFVKRIASRTIGRRESWEANPRLAGVPGSLPEFLPVEE